MATVTIEEPDQPGILSERLRSREFRSIVVPPEPAGASEGRQAGGGGEAGPTEGEDPGAGAEDLLEGVDVVMGWHC